MPDDVFEAAPETKDTVADAKPGICPVCGEEITRAPGARGRLKKYHDECRPLKTVGSVSKGKISDVPSTTKAERDADKAAAMVRGGMVKLALMLAVVDKYDGMVVMANTQSFVANARAVFLRYEPLRNEVLAMQGSGGIIGLVLSTLMIALPIAAHHKLLGVGRAAQILTELPMMLFKLSMQMKEGEQALTGMLMQMMQEADARKRQAQAQAQAQREKESAPA